MTFEQHESHDAVLTVFNDDAEDVVVFKKAHGENCWTESCCNPHLAFGYQIQIRYAEVVDALSRLQVGFS